MNKFIKGFTSRTTATAVAIVMMLSSLASFAMIISIVTAETPPTVPVPHTARYKMISKGYGEQSIFGIREDGSLWAWGWNGRGQLGIGNLEDQASPVRVGTDNDWKYVVSGVIHTLGLKEDGSLWAWGGNYDCALGIGTSYGTADFWGIFRGEDQYVPVRVGEDNDWAHISAGHTHSVGIRTDGSLWAWGAGPRGELGIGESSHEIVQGFLTSIPKPSPVQVGGDYDWAHISTFDRHNLAIRTDGSLWAWGGNINGQLGLGDRTAVESIIGRVGDNDRTVPTQVGADYDWMHVSAGVGHSLAIRTDGSLWAWGYNNSGQLGLGHSSGWDDCRTVPERIGTHTDWKQISAGGWMSLGLRADGSLWSWGENWGGMLGIGNTTDEHGPVQVGNDTNWVSVTAKKEQAFGIRSDGSLWVWGANHDGGLGIGYHGYYIEWYNDTLRFIFYDILTPFGPTPEQLEPLPKDPPPDLSQVEIGKDDDKAFVDIDDERIEDEKITFRWWRRVGNGEWEELDVPPNQPWVDVELDDDDDVTYKVDIYVDNEFLLARERIFNPLPPLPTPQNRFYGFAIPTAIAICIAFVCLITLIVIIILRRREERKQKKTAS